MSNDTVAQLERIEAELQNLAERCMKGVLQRTEVQSQLDQLIKQIEACLDPRSDAFRLFDRARRECLFWWSLNISGYAEKADCKHVTHWLERLPAILNEFEPSVLRAARPKDQFFISAGDTYRGMKSAFDIMRRASTSLG
ncbi:MAG: hypothetical protein AABZ61_01020, partial [Bacteroidota bacterium]